MRRTVIIILAILFADIARREGLDVRLSMVTCG
jgi:hypothetical protein